MWDAENRLVEVKKNAATQATFRYDPMDRRVEKVAGGTTFRYVYDNEDWIRRTGGTQVDIVHGPGIDEPLAQDSGGVVTYYHADALGSVQKHTSAAGAVVQTIEYDAWGNALSGTPGAYGFTSREPDLETGLQYYRARYYDARAGRFLSEDPAGLRDGPNRYVYAGDMPGMWGDPSGAFRLRVSYSFRKAGIFFGKTWIDKVDMQPNCTCDKKSGGWKLEFTVYANVVMQVGAGCPDFTARHEGHHANQWAMTLRKVLSPLAEAESRPYKDSGDCYKAAFEAMRRVESARHADPYETWDKAKQDRIDWYFPCRYQPEP